MESPANDRSLETPEKTLKFNRRGNIFHEKGMIQIIFGPMFSGKTTELLRRMRRYRIRNDSCLLFKTRDSRYEDDYDKVMTHDKINFLEAVSCDRLYEEVEATRNATVIGIDEGQFFPDIIEFCDDMANAGKIVIVAALDSDFRRQPFGNICQIVAKAERVTKLSSICHFCKEDAAFTARISTETEQKVIGGPDKYKPVCRECYSKVNKSEISVK
jgi:thymidine kinase